jgi:hypothetical protein
MFASLPHFCLHVYMTPVPTYAPVILCLTGMIIVYLCAIILFVSIFVYIMSLCLLYAPNLNKTFMFMPHEVSISVSV